jgi:hypothetical protein
MSATKYTYSINDDFPNQALFEDRLAQEIVASAITIAFDYISTSGDVCDIWFKDELPSADQTVLDGLVAAHSGAVLPEQALQVTTSKKASDGSPLFVTRKPDAPKLTLITPNWCDPTTWYQASVYVEDEVATDSGDHTTYNLAHQNVIDTYHGKITFEDYLKDSEGRSYRVAVKVDDVEKTEQDPHLGSGGDFTVDYAAGTVTFGSALAGTEVVKVTHHYADGSTFIVAPTAGKMLLVEKVEVQFSGDIEMNDTVVFQAYGLVDVFAPQLIPGVPSGTKIPLGDPLKYKTLPDLLNDSNHAYPAYPAVGGSNWRALKQAAYVFSWAYDVGTTVLIASYGMEIHISLEHDVPNSGAFATAALYCTSEDEVLS